MRGHDLIYLYQIRIVYPEHVVIANEGVTTLCHSIKSGSCTQTVNSEL